MLWLFTWDDHINDFNGYLYKDAVGARQYCEQTIEFTRHALGLPVKESKNGPRKCSSLLDILVCSFDVVGEAIQAVYTSGRYSQGGVVWKSEVQGLTTAQSNQKSLRKNLSFMCTLWAVSTKWA
jgi:hypothetical protein